MTAMAASWRWHPMAIVRSALAAFLALSLVLTGLASAQGEPETRWAANDDVRLSVLMEDGALAVDWQPLSPSSLGPPPALSAIFQHGPRETPLEPVLSLPFREAGLSTAIIYVFPDVASARFDDQKAEASLIANLLTENQTLILVHATDGGWRIITEISGTAPAPLRGTAMAALTLPEPTEGVSPAELLDDRAESRRFVILGAGEAATPALAALAGERGERFLVSTAGFPAPLPEAYLPLGNMTDTATRDQLFAFLSAGEVAVYEVATGGERLPGERGAQTTISLASDGSEIPLSISFPVNMPDASLTTLLSPVNGIGWLVTQGRRLYGLINLIGWGALIGLLFLIIRLPARRTDRDAPVIAQIELYGLGLSADVRYLPFTIGRSASCDLVADHEETSRRHAQIRRNSAGELELVDLMSANGTFLDGDRLNQPATLGASQAVTFGGVRGHIHVLGTTADGD